MPLVAQAMACYVAGLIVGGVAAPFLALVACLVAAVAALFAGRRALCALAMLAAAGVVAQGLTTSAQTRCLDGVLHRRPIIVRLLGEASPGSAVRADSPMCGAAVSLFVVEGRAGLGSLVAVEGSAARSRMGWVVEHATLTPVGPVPGLDAVRAAAGEKIDRAFRDDAPLARAMLIADKQQLSPDLKDRFARAGLAHLLAIAGLHLAAVGLLMEVVLAWLGLAPTARSTLLLIAIIGYVLMIGSPASAVRAAVMLAMRAVSRLLQRPTSPWALLAIGASEPLIDPAVALAIGYQLSVVCVAGLIVAAQLTARVMGRRKSSRAYRTAAAVIATTLATAASAPLVAASFGRVSLIAPLSNVLAEPLFAALQPLLFATMCLTFIPGAARFLADSAHPLMAALVGLVGVLSSVPGSSVAVRPDATETLLGVGAATALLAACADHRRWTRWAIGAVVCVALIAWLPALPRRSRSLELRIVRSGRGETIVLTTPHGTTIGLGEADRGRLGLRAQTTDGVLIHPIVLASQASLGEPPIVLIQFGTVRAAIGGPFTKTQQLKLGELHALDGVDVMVIASRQRSSEPSAALVGTAPPRVVLLMGSGQVDADLARRLVASGAELIRTQQAGSVSLRVDRGDLWIRVGAEDWVQLRRTVL